jgi:predicted MFS family arabinose efflux permease
MALGRTGAVIALGTAQTLAWASSYYLPAVLAAPMARDVGVSTPTVFAAFSAALIVSALLGPFAGRAIDRWGGRPVLVGTNAVFALGLVGLALSDGPLALLLAWLVMGIGMGSGLYEAAFAALVRLYGRESRTSITGITLIAGFASTVGWPLSALLEAQFGWRGACLAWAALHVLLGMPLNALLPRAQAIDVAPAPTAAAAPAAGAAQPNLRPMVVLSFVFATTMFVSTAMAAHLPTLLQAHGASLAAAVAAGALIGPAQVGARLFEFGLLRRWHPLMTARLAVAAHPIGALVLALVGAPAAAAFTLLHGAGNGILTITKGTLPLALFGPMGYGARQGLMMVPARFAQAAAPWLFGLCLEHWGGASIALSAALGMAAFGALFLLPQRGADAASQGTARASSST